MLWTMDRSDGRRRGTVDSGIFGDSQTSSQMGCYVWQEDREKEFYRCGSGAQVRLRLLRGWMKGDRPCGC